jgi:hypothetical protein
MAKVDLQQSSVRKTIGQSIDRQVPPNDTLSTIQDARYTEEQKKDSNAPSESG